VFSSTVVDDMRLEIILLRDRYEASSQGWVGVRVVNEGTRAQRLYLGALGTRFELVTAESRKPARLTRFGEEVLVDLSGAHRSRVVRPGAAEQIAFPVGGCFDISWPGKYLLSVEQRVGLVDASRRPILRVADIPLEVVWPTPPALPEPPKPSTAPPAPTK
jgi:hypothetical protein